MSKITPCLWSDDKAEEAANYYVSLLPDSRIEHVQRNVTDTPGGKEGTVLVVYFTLAGQSFMVLNGGTRLEYTHVISFSIECENQAEIDRLWNTLIEGGGKAVQCGWLTDRYGMSWQIVAKILPKMLADPDQAKAARVREALLQMVKLDIAALQKAYDGHDDGQSAQV